MTTNHHRRLTQKLAGYAAAAGAALGAEDALAEIKYTSLGPDGVAITDVHGFNIDLDGDSITNIALAIWGAGSVTSCSHPGDCAIVYSQHLLASAFPANRILATASGSDALALPAGFEIDVASHGDTYIDLAYARFTSVRIGVSFSDSGGAFFKNRAYLGLVFDAIDGPHAGWAEGLATTRRPHEGHLNAYIYGFAYETTPGRSIAAGAVPEPPSLVLLVAGAAGLATLRKKRRTQS